MVIAMNRIGNFKRFIIRSIINFFIGIKNKIVELITGRTPHYYEKEEFEDEEKGYQGENGDLKNRPLDVTLNHIDMSSAEKNKADYADSSIGEGMDITIQGVNGHLKNGEKDNISIGSRDSSWIQTKKNSLLMHDTEKSKLSNADSSIGEGMDISIHGEAEPGGVKESCTESIHSGDSRWNRSQNKKNESISGSMEKIELDEKEDQMLPSPEDIKKVEEVMYDPIDEIVVEDCCPPGCYKACPCCIGDPDSPFWQLWYKNRLQISR